MHSLLLSGCHQLERCWHPVAGEMSLVAAWCSCCCSALALPLAWCSWELPDTAHKRKGAGSRAAPSWKQTALASSCAALEHSKARATLEKAFHDSWTEGSRNATELILMLSLKLHELINPRIFTVPSSQQLNQGAVFCFWNKKSQLNNGIWWPSCDHSA